MNQRTRLLLLIPHLGGGGAERVTEILAARVNPKQYEVHLGVVTGIKPPPHSLPAHVTIHFLGAPRVRRGLAAILRLVWRLRPDAILSGMAHLNLAVLLLRPALPRGTRVLVRQNAEPRARDAGYWTPALYRWLYPKADTVICQTPAMASKLQHTVGPRVRVHVLINPVEVDAVRAAVSSGPANGKLPGMRLLAIGRLAPEKGFDLLLEAFAALRPQFPALRLIILGAGSERARLLAIARQLALNESVHFAGHVKNPETWLARANLFVLSSRREGLPNALLEAAAADLPIVATPAEGGLSGLLAGKEGVWLARETSAAALESAIRSALLAIRSKQRYAHAWIEEFRAERIVPRYEALIDSVLDREP